MRFAVFDTSCSIILKYQDQCRCHQVACSFHILCMEQKQKLEN